MTMLLNDKNYIQTLDDIKARIRTAQRNAVMSVNQELVMLYWSIGKTIDERSVWGNKFIENLERDLRIEFPKYKGFSLRNLKYMVKFYREYPKLEIVQPLVAQLPWAHNIAILDKAKTKEERDWYIGMALEHGWTKRVLIHQLDIDLWKRQAKTKKIDNFMTTLPAPQSELVQKATKDPYIFDFLAEGAEDYYETKLEQALVDNVAKLLLELGTGFAFIGNQYKLVVDGEEFFIDMLFYNLELRCYVVVELKNTMFKPEFAGKLNFYLSAVDSLLKKPHDNPTIGLLLCKSKKNMVAEYALRDMAKPIGVSEFKLQSKLPKEFENVLPSAEDIKARIKME